LRVNKVIGSSAKSRCKRASEQGPRLISQHCLRVGSLPVVEMGGRKGNTTPGPPGAVPLNDACDSV